VRDEEPWAIVLALSQVGLNGSHRLGSEKDQAWLSSFANHVHFV
jgi:hypothetical protein